MSDLFDQVCAAISSIRVTHVNMEYDLQKDVAAALIAQNITFKKEYQLGPGNRVDFFIDGIAVEIKKGKPNRQRVLDQIQRYARFECVDAVVLVIQTSLQMPVEIVNEKPCIVIGLQKLWGIAFYDVYKNGYELYSSLYPYRKIKGQKEIVN